MSVLAIFYSAIGVADPAQPLALPEGSIRALIAFSLVLIFVCLGAYLYSSVNGSALAPVGTEAGLTEVQLSELKSQFVVAYEPARKPDGSIQTENNDGKTPLYNATYFNKPNKDAADFAKQIFTTLATVFVSVVSFYFGSSTASSAARGAGGGGAAGAPAGGPGPQSALSEAKAAAHDAKGALDRAVDAAAKANSFASAASVDPGKKAAATADAGAAQKALAVAKQASSDADQQVQMASKAASDAATASTDSAKSTATTAVFKARDTAKQLAEQAEASAAEAERLRDKIKSDTGG